jgi:hypothetical protein
VQKQTRRAIPGSPAAAKLETVQDALETALVECCRPSHPVVVYPSSRLVKISGLSSRNVTAVRYSIDVDVVYPSSRWVIISGLSSRNVTAVQH